MPRGGNRCKQRPVRYEFFEILIDFAAQHNGALPTHYGWWQLVRLHGYTLQWSSFRGHTEKLERDGLIRFAHNVIVINPSRWECLASEPIQKSFSLHTPL